MAGDADDCDEDGPPFPWTVRVAGMMWLGVGGLGLACLPFVCMAGVCLSTAWLLAVAKFLHSGICAVRGEAEDTLRDGLGSSGIGLIVFGLSGALIFDGNVGAAAMLTAPAALMVTAGAFAIGGRTEYLRWRECQPPEDGPEYDPDRDLREGPDSIDPPPD